MPTNSEHQNKRYSPHDADMRPVLVAAHQLFRARTGGRERPSIKPKKSNPDLLLKALLDRLERKAGNGGDRCDQMEP